MSTIRLDCVSAPPSTIHLPTERSPARWSIENPFRLNSISYRLAAPKVVNCFSDDRDALLRRLEQRVAADSPELSGCLTMLQKLNFEIIKR
jgi:hypothetical protein